MLFQLNIILAILKKDLQRLKLFRNFSFSYKSIFCSHIRTLSRRERNGNQFCFENMIFRFEVFLNQRGKISFIHFTPKTIRLSWIQIVNLQTDHSFIMYYTKTKLNIFNNVMKVDQILWLSWLIKGMMYAGLIPWEKTTMSKKNHKTCNWRVNRHLVILKEFLSLIFLPNFSSWSADSEQINDSCSDITALVFAMFIVWFIVEVIHLVLCTLENEFYETYHYGV